MTKRHLKFTVTCPQCGCSAVSNLTPEQIRERFGDVPNVDLECSECLHKYSSEMKTVCPEWDEACRMKES